MRELTLELDVNNKIPLYEQIYEHIRNEIKAGNISCNTKLPSTRTLAAHLDVSRSTVDMAYAQLVSEGYIEARPYKGYYASEISLLYDIHQEDRDLPHGEEETKENDAIDFSPFGIELDSFPFNTWRKLSKNLLSADNKELFASCHYKGAPKLRQTICHYLYEARGVRCTPKQIILGAGNEYLLMLLNSLFEEKLPIAMENPTYANAYNVFRRNGNDIIPISVDKSGMVVEELCASKAELAYVMPSHQFPLGIVMPIKRRLALLNWACKKEGRYIIEDDYDSEFRYVGKPIPALQGVDDGNHVIYMGTFSKSIAPSIRMSYMVLPHSLMKCLSSQKQMYSQTVSKMDQMIVNDFIQEGYFERHLNKMRSIYRAKHDFILAKLKECSGKLSVSGENSGLHILLTVDSPLTEEKLIQRALKAGVKVHGVSGYYILDSGNQNSAMPCSGQTLWNTHPTFLIGFASLSIAQIEEGIEKLRIAWKL